MDNVEFAVKYNTGDSATQLRTLAQALDGVTGKIEENTRKQEHAARAARASQPIWSELTSKLGIVKAAFQKLTSGVEVAYKELRQLSDLGGTMIPLEATFRRLGGSIDRLKGATGFQVANRDLMRYSNAIRESGIASEDQLVKLTQLAFQSSQSIGVAWDQVASGISSFARGGGINSLSAIGVDIEGISAALEIAGVSAESQRGRMIALTMAIQDLEEGYDGLSTRTSDTSDAIAGAEATMRNARDEMAVGFASSERLTSAIESIREALDGMGIDWREVGEDLADATIEFVRVINEGIHPLIEALHVLSRVAWAAITVANIVPRLLGSIGIPVFREYAQANIEATDAIAASGNALASLGDRVEAVTGRIRRALVGSRNELEGTSDIDLDPWTEDPQQSVAPRSSGTPATSVRPRRQASARRQASSGVDQRMDTAARERAFQELLDTSYEVNDVVGEIYDDLVARELEVAQAERERLREVGEIAERRRELADEEARQIAENAGLKSRAHKQFVEEQQREILGFAKTDRWQTKLTTGINVFANAVSQVEQTTAGVFASLARYYENDEKKQEELQQAQMTTAAIFSFVHAAIEIAQVAASFPIVPSMVAHGLAAAGFIVAGSMALAYGGKGPSAPAAPAPPTAQPEQTRTETEHEVGGSLTILQVNASDTTLGYALKRTEHALSKEGYSRYSEGRYA